MNHKTKHHIGCGASTKTHAQKVFKLPFPALRGQISEVANKTCWQQGQLTNNQEDEIVEIENKIVKHIKKKDKIKNSKHKKVLVKESSLSILSTNAMDMKDKEEDLKNKVRFFKSGIFAVQEGYFAGISLVRISLL